MVGVRAVVVDVSQREGDGALVARCLVGDRAAERELFRRERGRVHATLYRVLGSNRDMDDLIQETFLEVFRSLRGFRGESKLSTWIDRIAARAAYRYLSSKRPATVALELIGEVRGDEGEVDARAQAREGIRRLYLALERISPVGRVALALHVLDGRSIPEVAELVGASVIATKLRIWRARRELERRATEDPILLEYLSATAEDEP
jgi:RNA polymerase sigma-70 factor (ECF subfamily)